MTTAPGKKNSSAALALALVAGASVACGPDRSERTDLGSRPQGVVVLLIDTARTDHLSAYGYERDTTPTLEWLARQGVLFEQVQAPSPWTIPTMASLWTGVYPSRHGAGIMAARGERRTFPEEGEKIFRGFSMTASTLPRRLRELGYQTYAFFANPLLKSDCYLHDFDDVAIAYKPADALVDWAIDRMPEFVGHPFFLYLHFFDLHEPIDPPDDYLTRYLPAEDRDGLDGEPFVKLKEELSRFGGFDDLEALAGEAFAHFRTLKAAAYDGAVRFVDDQIERLIEEFEDAGLRERTLFVVTADHGEELWDHWELERDAYDVEAAGKVGVGHGHTLFQELLSVPLVVCGPGVERGGRVASRVSLCDLGATLLELVAPGDSEADRLGDGVSFAAALRGELLENRITLSEGLAYGYELHALVDAEGFKYIWAPHRGRDLMFSLPTDAREEHDLIGEQPERAATLRARLMELVSSLEAAPLPEGDPHAVDRKAIRGLGYTHDK
ncbi:MAG: sulfatase [Planctomycetota bacterium]